MPEENEKAGHDKPDVVDTVKREDYNKIVESHNALKMEKEKLEKQMKEKEINDQKSQWDKEKEELNKKIDDLKKSSETKVSKGIVSEKKEPENNNNIEHVKKMLDDKMPDRKVNPENFASRIQRYGHYKSATTKQYTNEQLGMGLSLHASAQKVNPELVKNARESLPQEDIVLNKR